MLPLKLPLLFLLVFSQFSISGNLTVELSTIREGQIKKLDLNGFPVMIHHRTKEQIESIEQTNYKNLIKDVRYISYQNIARSHGHEYASKIMDFTEAYITKDNSYMSEQPEYGVYSFVSPILGCAVYEDENGFTDPCKLAKFDYTGRVVSPKKYEHLRLLIPPYKIEGNILTFLDDYKAQKIIDFTPDILSMKEPPIERAIYAVVWDRLDILKKIVAKYPEVLTQTNSNGTTLLHASASELSTLEYLLSFKLVNVNAINDSNYTPLQISLLIQNIENAKLLVKNGATMDSISENGKTALSALNYLVKKQGYSVQDANQLLNELK